jgi:hypothetical protein
VPSFIPGTEDVASPYGGMSTATESIGFPEIFDHEQAEEMIKSAKDTAPVLGVSASGDPVTVDFVSESPHVLVNASTGGGKSVVVRSLMAQHLYHGGIACVLDVKRFSHIWADGLDNVTTASALPDIGDALVQLGREVHRRLEVVEDHLKAGGDIDDAPVGPRLLVVFEEINSTMGQLSKLTKRIPQGTYNAVDAYNDVLNLGRAAKVHMVAVAQLATFRAMGGSEVVENFATRVLLRYTRTAWRYLAADCGQAVAAPDELGRGMTCHGGKARETQYLYLSEEEARAYADGTVRKEEEQA